MSLPDGSVLIPSAVVIGSLGFLLKWMLSKIEARIADIGSDIKTAVATLGLHATSIEVTNSRVTRLESDFAALSQKLSNRMVDGQA